MKHLRLFRKLVVILCLAFTASKVDAQTYKPQIPGPPRIITPKVQQINFDSIFKTDGNKITTPYDIAVWGKRYYKPQKSVITDDKGFNISAWKGKQLDVVMIVNGYKILGLAKNS